MTYLVDANVLSEATKPDPDPRVISWLRKNEANIVVDPFILGEIQFGILQLPPGNRRKWLERRFEQGVRRAQCLSWDAQCGLRWARLLADLRKRGEAMSIKDSLIATTALVYRSTVVTRNRRDFKKAGVKLTNPFD